MRATPSMAGKEKNHFKASSSFEELADLSRAGASDTDARSGCTSTGEQSTGNAVCCSLIRVWRPRGHGSMLAAKSYGRAVLYVIDIEAFTGWLAFVSGPWEGLCG